MRDDLELGLAPAAEPETALGAIDYGDVSLGAEDAGRLSRYLTEELDRAEAETRDFHDELIKWRQYLDPKEKEKNFPWPGAANVFVPIPRMAVDTVKATGKQSIVRQKKIFTAEAPKNATWIPEGKVDDVARAAEDFAQIVAEDPAMFALARLLDEWLEEILVAGFAAVKIGIEEDSQEIFVGPNEKKVVTFRRGPRVQVVPTGTWVWPAGLWRTVQEMPWTGHWEELTASELRRRAAEPWGYRFVEEAIGMGEGTSRDEQSAARLGTTRQSPSASAYKTFSISIVWDLYDDGDLHDLLVTFNKQSGRIHRIIYKPGSDGVKDYYVECASPRAGVIFGRGIIEPIAQACLAINTAVNQTFDAQTLSNAPSILYPEDSEAAKILASGFYPGLPLSYREQKDELDVLKFPPPDAISFQMVDFFLGIIGRLTRTGGRMGDVEGGKRVPASLGLAMAQTGAELLDEMIDRLRDTLGRVMGRYMVLCFKTDPTIFVRLLGEERGALLHQAIEESLAQPRGVEELIRLRLTASSATRSIDLERQNSIAIIQISFNWYKQIIELTSLAVQTLGNPQVPQEARQILVDVVRSSQEQLRRAVELSNVPDAATVIPDLAARMEALVGAPAGVPSPQPASVLPPTGAGPGAPPLQPGGGQGGIPGLDLEALLGAGGPQ